MNRNYVRRDQKMVVMMGASRGLHMNDLLDDQSLVDDHRDVPVGHCMNVMDGRNLGASRVNRNYAPRDQNLVAKMDGNLYRHTNVMDDRNDLKMDGTTDASLCLRMNDRLDDLSLDANHVSHNCVHRGPKMDANLDGMNLHVMYY